jgi:hypothetical protein
MLTKVLVLYYNPYNLNSYITDGGGTTMLENVIEFFRNLPEKQCATCGEKIEEQHECYGNQCDQCNTL